MGKKIWNENEQRAYLMFIYGVLFLTPAIRLFKESQGESVWLLLGGVLFTGISLTTLALGRVLYLRYRKGLAPPAWMQGQGVKYFLAGLGLLPAALHIYWLGLDEPSPEKQWQSWKIGFGLLALLIVGIILIARYFPPRREGHWYWDHFTDEK